VTDQRVEIEVWQDGMCVAGVSAPHEDAMKEAVHYAMVYGQDGPVEVFMVKRGKRTAIAVVAADGVIAAMASADPDHDWRIDLHAPPCLPPSAGKGEDA